MQHDLEVEAGAEDVLPDEALVVRVGDRLTEPLGTQTELTAQVDERGVALDRERRDDHALDHLVRIALDEHVVLEGGRLAFVAVHREVAREDILRQERPLLPGAEARAAAATEARRRHLGDDVLGRHAERLLQTLVRAVADRGVDGPRVVGALAQELGDDARLGCHRSAPPRWLARCGPGYATYAPRSRLSVTDPGPGDGARHPLARLVLVDHRLGVAAGD